MANLCLYTYIVQISHLSLPSEPVKNNLPRITYYSPRFFSPLNCYNTQYTLHTVLTRIYLSFVICTYARDTHSAKSCQALWSGGLPAATFNTDGALREASRGRVLIVEDTSGRESKTLESARRYVSGAPIFLAGSISAGRPICSTTRVYVNLLFGCATFSVAGAAGVCVLFWERVKRADRSLVRFDAPIIVVAVVIFP